MIFLDKWLERRIQQKQEKKREETKLKNWFKLYKVLHCGEEPICLNCANNKDCFKKYGIKKENWPLIEGRGSCKSFKESITPPFQKSRMGVSGHMGISGMSGVSGIAGPNSNVGGYSGYVKYSGKYPPWQRGLNSCNHLCSSCPYLNKNLCTRP